MRALRIMRKRPLLAGLRPSSLNASGLIVEGRSTTLTGRSPIYKADAERMK